MMFWAQKILDIPERPWKLEVVYLVPKAHLDREVEPTLT